MDGDSAQRWRVARNGEARRHERADGRRRLKRDLQTFPPAAAHYISLPRRAPPFRRERSERRKLLKCRGSLTARGFRRRLMRGQCKGIPLCAGALRGMVRADGGEKDWAAAHRTCPPAIATRRRPFSPLPRQAPPFRCERSERRKLLKSRRSLTARRFRSALARCAEW